MSTYAMPTLTLDARSMLPIAHGTCDGGDCERKAVSFAYSEKLDALIPVCRRHILVYRVRNGLWQAEDEFAELRFARRARTAARAQRRILRDQRAAVRGRESRAQRVKRIRADRTLQDSETEETAP
jgi:hypothetical protein